MSSLEETVRVILESAASHRVDNWRDMGLPDISMRDAMIMDLGPLLEDFCLDMPCSSMVHEIARSVLTQRIDFDCLYGTSMEDVERRFPTHFNQIQRASSDDIYESLRSIMEGLAR